MSGLYLIAIVIAYSAGALWAAGRIRSAWGKALAVVVAFLLPTADAVYGRLELERACKAEGGTKILRTVSGVDGFYSPYADEKFITRYGFRYVESGLTPRSYVRLERAEGKLKRTPIDQPGSRYQFRERHGAPADTYLVDRYEMVDRSTDEILAVTTNINYAGGWVERVVGKVAGSRPTAVTCNVGNSLQVHEKLITSTLRPVGQ